MLAKLTKAIGLLCKDVASLRGDVKRIESVREVVRHGKDGVSPDLSTIAEAAAKLIPTPKDGETPDFKMIAEAAAKLVPTAAPGRDAIAPSVRDIADVVLANIKTPKDGVSPDLKVVAAAAARLIPKPKNGVSPTAQEVAAVLPTPKRGPPGLKGDPGVSVTNVQLTNNELFVYLDGKKKSAGKIKVPTVSAPFNPGRGESGGGGGRAIPYEKPKYLESNSTSKSTQSPGPLSPLPNLLLPTTGTFKTYRTEAQIQFQSFAQLATPVLLQNLSDLTAELNALPNKVSHIADFGNGEILAPGVYDVSSASTHQGVLTFDGQGDPDALFVMIINGAEAVSTAATSLIINEAQSSNIFWVVVGALTIGAGCDLKGTYIGSGAIGVDTLTLDGRILTPTGAIALTGNAITVPEGTTSLSLGFLTTFILFSGAGAVSNTVVTSGIKGSVASNLGAVSGFPNLDGNIYTSNSTVISIDFLLMSNGVEVESSTVSYQIVNQSQGRGFFDIVHLAGISFKDESQTIEIRARVILGTIVVGNRNIFAIEL